VTPRLILVKWVDCVTKPSWALTEDVSEGLTEGADCETVGWLVSETEDAIIVAASRNSDGGWADRSRIPRGMITSLSSIHDGGYSPLALTEQTV